MTQCQQYSIANNKLIWRGSRLADNPFFVIAPEFEMCHGNMELRVLCYVSG